MEGRPYIAGPVTKRPALGCLVEIAETVALTLIILFVIQTSVARPLFGVLAWAT